MSGTPYVLNGPAPVPEPPVPTFEQNFDSAVRAVRVWRDDFNDSFQYALVLYWALIVVGALLLLSKTRGRSVPSRATAGKKVF